MNAVRMSHYPPDAHSLKLVTNSVSRLDELGGGSAVYDHALRRRLYQRDDPTATLTTRASCFGTTATRRLEQENDDSLRSGIRKNGRCCTRGNSFVASTPSHYGKNSTATRSSSAGRDIYMPTEFMHGLYDGGAGAGLWDTGVDPQEQSWGGGFIWRSR